MCVHSSARRANDNCMPKKNYHGKSSRAPNAVSCASLRPTLTASCVFPNVGSRVAPARVCLCFVCVCAYVQVCPSLRRYKAAQTAALSIWKKKSKHDVVHHETRLRKLFSFLVACRISCLCLIHFVLLVYVTTKYSCQSTIGRRICTKKPHQNERAH